MYVPRINVKKTVLKSNGFGLNIIQAKILKIVLSINDEIIVEKLFLNQRNLLLRMKIDQFPRKLNLD